ncbi:MAG: DUF5665 domain-containing protein [Patescibacteria group bacterium]|nr:DUF5665 domain-containing protein [Patescibacteria group bacterium]
MSLRNNKSRRVARKNKEEAKSFVDILGSDDFDEYINFIKSPTKTFFFNFLRGTGFGLGTILGTAIVLSLILYIVSLLGGLPIVGDYVRSIVSHINLGK